MSCTSKLSSWNVPRNLKVEPKPVDTILITRHHFGIASGTKAKVTLYDPRAPVDRAVNEDKKEKLSLALSNCLQSSCYFLFHGIESNVKGDGAEIEIESICEDIPTSDLDIQHEARGSEHSPFNDSYDISSPEFRSIIEQHNEVIDRHEIDRIEQLTRGQSSNHAWWNLRQKKLTASNFYSAAVRQKEPDNLLHSIMYQTEVSTTPLQYGKEHEDVAVSCYVTQKRLVGNPGLQVYEVGTIISLEEPGLAASLDRKVYDPQAKGSKTGGLEVKCPISKKGMSVEEACKDKTFFLESALAQKILRLVKKSAYLGEISTFLTKISCTKVTFVNTVNTTLKVCKYVKKDVFS